MKKVIVNAADYELYKILLPWKFLFGHEKNFILGELEKRHPRFSGNCCYDTKYVLHKKNLLAEVVVMEKANLAHYKNAGGVLYLENPRKRSVFSNRAKIQRFFGIFLILVAGLLSLRIAKSVLFEKNAQVVAHEISVSENQIEENAGEVQSALKTSEEILKEVFASVSRRGGKISDFSYQKNLIPSKNKEAGECKFSIYGCNSEEVANAQYCVVSFKDNEPHFELILPFEKSVKYIEEKRSSADENQIFSYEEESLEITAVRQKLRDFGAIIESEHNGEEKAEFSFVANSSHLYSCLKICAESAEKLLWSEERFSLSEKGGKCRVKVSFAKKSKNGSGGEILQSVATYAFLFASEAKIVPKKQALFASQSTQKPIIVREKLGEIRRKDGSVFICYRNIDGKMTFERKETVNE